MYLRRKYGFVLAAALTFCMLNLHGQQTNDVICRHEVAVSYGVGPSSVWVHFFGDIIDAIAGSDYDDSTFLGPLSAEYFFHPRPSIGVGGVFTFNSRHNDRMNNGTKVGERDRTYFTIMPALKFDYVRTKNFGMYLKLAIGCTFGSDKETCDGKPDSNDHSSFFNFQLSLLGLEAGSRNVRGFAELGVGEQGMLQAGLRYRF